MDGVRLAHQISFDSMAFKLSFFIVFFKTVLGGEYSGKFQKNSSTTFISKESP